MNLTLRELVERTEARKAAGLLPDYRNRAKITGTISLPVRECEHRGAILEYCSSCRGDGKHVRECCHEANPSQKCTLSPVSDKVWCCANCSYQSPRSEAPRV